MRMARGSCSRRIGNHRYIPIGIAVSIGRVRTRAFPWSHLVIMEFMSVLFED